jgi:hypothetical protein
MSIIKASVVEAPLLNTETTSYTSGTTSVYINPYQSYGDAYARYHNTNEFPESPDDDERDFLADLPTIKRSKKAYSSINIGQANLERMSVVDKIKAYEATKDKHIIYRLILSDFSNYIRQSFNALGVIPEDILMRTVDEDVREFDAALAKHFKYSKVTAQDLALGVSLKEEILRIYRELVTSFYTFSDITKPKQLNISIHDKLSLISILSKCREKGILLDPAISNIQDIEFSTDKALEISILLVYLPSISTMLYLQYDVSTDYSGTKGFLLSVSDLPDVIEKKEEEMIKINDKLYSRKSFESLVETNFDNFVQNLEIDYLLDKKDTDAVVDKLNLL